MINPTQTHQSIYVVMMIPYDDAEDMDDIGIGGNGGCIKRGDRIEYYLDGFDEFALLFVRAMRKYVLEHKIKITGAQHQGKGSYAPVFSNGMTALYSMRAWGDLMAAIWSTEEDHDYSYMDFYM